jgi:opacity protein-like surface antigen
MRLWLSAAVAIAAGFGATAACRAESPWDVSGSIGGVFRPSDQVNTQFFHAATPSITVPGTNRRDFDPGVAIDAALGYRLSPHIRIEGEISYAGYAVDKIFPQTFAPGFPALNGQAFDKTSGAGVSREGGAANIFYDFSPIARVTPYVGIGAGASFAHANTGVFADAGGASFRTPGVSAAVGTAMVEGGLSIPLWPHLALVPAYRYLHAFAPQGGSAHVVKVGLRYSF